MFEAFDTETHLWSPGNMAPLMVCLSLATETDQWVKHRNDALTLAWCKGALSNPSTVLVGHNVSYDLAVICRTYPVLLPLVFKALDEDRVTCTLVRQKLLDIATGLYKKRPKKGFYTLQNLAKLHGYPTDLDKDTWRLKYGELDQIPFEEWPQGAIEYSQHDALATQWVCYNQEDQDDGYLVDQFRQVRAQFALHLVSCAGIVTDPVAVEAYYERVQSDLESCKALLLAKGLIYEDKKGWHKRTKEAGAYMLRVWPECPKTPKGAPELSADACEQSLDSVMVAFAKWGSSTSGMSRVEELCEPIIHTRFDSLLVSGRTSSSGPNIQNRPTVEGDRECFAARPGCVFLDLDFDGLELRTVAQSLLFAGFKSRLAEVLNTPGSDPHAMVAAELLRVPLAEVLRRKKDPSDKEVYLARQSGKIANFGLAGGLGWRALQNQARAQYKVVLDQVQAKALIASWHQTWPEFKQYFAWINQQCRGGFAWVTQFTSGRVRGNCPYTEACNTYFQGLGADVAKASLWALTKACYLEPGVLLGSRIVNFVHDQYILETPEENLTEKAKEMERVVLSEANKWLPDVPATGTAVPCRRWSKNATLILDKVTKQPTYEPWEWSGPK